MANTISSTAGLVASNAFLAREQACYRTGYGVALASIWVTILSATALVVALRAENARRDRGDRDDRLRLPAE